VDDAGGVAIRVYLLANSQGTGAGLESGRAYPFIARDALVPRYDVHVLAVSGWSIREFNHNRENVTELRPDLTVLQVGIVECSRRILSGREKRILAAVPGGRRLTKALHDRRRQVIRARNRLGLNTRLFSVEEFEREVSGFVTAVETSGSRVLVLETPTFGPAYERRWFPLINEDIGLFNRVLRQFGAVQLLPADADLEAVWVPGTVHLNKRGHELAAERLASLVEEHA